MRVLPIVLLVLRVSSAAVAEDAAAQEDTGTLWAALRAGGHVARNVLNICSLPSVVMHGEPSPPPHAPALGSKDHAVPVGNSI